MVGSGSSQKHKHSILSEYGSGNHIKIDHPKVQVHSLWDPGPSVEPEPIQENAKKQEESAIKESKKPVRSSDNISVDDLLQNGWDSFDE